MANVALIFLVAAALAGGLVWLGRVMRNVGAGWSAQLAERNAVVAQNQELAVATIQTRDYTVDSRFTQG